MKLSIACIVCACLFTTHSVSASPFVNAGDAALRQDIQRLADAGIIKGPVTAWPLAWGPVAADIGNVGTETELPAAVLAALHRVRQRAVWETGTNELRFRARASFAEAPARIRGYDDTPRESGEIGGGLSWTGNRISVDIRGQVVDSPSDGEDYRVDGSSIAFALGNYSLSVNTLDRWWGPGWDGSLILSNNARPVPSISLDRNFTDPFASKWLQWLGPWDLSIHHGQFETDREIPNARFFGMRFNFRPLPSLEVGLSRTAQWCGNGRPCGLDTFTDLLVGADNIGGQGVTINNEPGNQLAGIDFRWSRALFGTQAAFYGQLIGEDEAGGFPSRYLGQFGVEAYGALSSGWVFHWFGEFAGTTCQFHESSELFNCAYNHAIYQTGYRYRGRSVGHGADNDARLVTTGVTLIDNDDNHWKALLRYGALNRGGLADPRNTVTPTPEDMASLDVTHSREFSYGLIEIGIGVEWTDGIAGASSGTSGRAFLRWRSAR